jgi:IMP dehydrogenase
MQIGLSYDDVLLVPKYSDIKSRSEVDLSSELSSGLNFSLPLMSSPMDTVTESGMSVALNDAGGLGIVHRYNSVEEQAAIIKDISSRGVKNIGAAIGATGDYIVRAGNLQEAGANIICLDVAHGYHALVKDALKELRKTFGDSVHLMAGNVATLDAFEALSDWGADSIRIGIGGGSICSTRLVTGHGVPTFASILDCARTTYETKLIADGGIKTSGDMVKSLAAGADFVMAGSMLAGTEESPGETLRNNSGKRYKVYRGMASTAAQKDWRGKSSTAEGVSTTIPFKGSVVDVLEDIAGGLRSGLSYTGVRNLKELRSKSTFIRQSQAGQVESSTHIHKRY